MPKHYGHLARILHWCVDQTMTRSLEEMDLTAAQGQIMGCIAHCAQPPCPRDVEEQLHLSHPTVSGLLSRLERKEFLALRPDPTDRRCKRIYILPRGRDCLETMHRTIHGIEDQIVHGFTPEEQEQFHGLLERAIANMGASPCIHKEESKK